LKKGDLGGFENLQGEGIYGKRYNLKYKIFLYAQDDKMLFRSGIDLLGDLLDKGLQMVPGAPGTNRRKK
jgi:hypothetical protein